MVSGLSIRCPCNHRNTKMSKYVCSKITLAFDAGRRRSNVDQVIAFVESSFKGACLREKQNAKMRFEIPQQEDKTLGAMFGFIEVMSSGPSAMCFNTTIRHPCSRSERASFHY